VESDRGASRLRNAQRLEAAFDDIIARQAVAYAGDARELNDIRNKVSSRWRRAVRAWVTGVPEGHWLPRHNLKKARALARAYERKHGEPITYEY